MTKRRTALPIRGAAIAAAAILAIAPGGAIAGKGEIKNLGFDFFFNANPGESPDDVDVFEGEYLKFVLHQNDIFGIEGLAVPDKNKVVDGVSYFLYPGNYCSRDCSDPDQLARPAEVYPFSQTYYVLAQPQQGESMKVVLLSSAVVQGNDTLSRVKLKGTPAQALSGFKPLAANEAPALLEKYFLGDGTGPACGQQAWELFYAYSFVGEDGTVVETQGSVPMGQWEGGDAPASLDQARKWIDGQMGLTGGGLVIASLPESGHVTLTAAMPQGQAVDPYTGKIVLPAGTVLGIRVLDSGPCGRLLGFPSTGMAGFAFPFEKGMPAGVYENAPFASESCTVEEALSAEIRPKLKDEKRKVFRCTFTEQPSFKGPFWAFLTVPSKGPNDDAIRVVEYPVIVASNGMEISNVEARVSYEGSPESTESFHNPSLDAPTFYYDVPKTKAGVYVLTPVITYSDPVSGDSKAKAGHAIYIKVRPREDFSMVRLQMGVIAYSELRAMAFTVMITPVLNKSFFKRKFFPAWYPMPHIGIRLGSQDDGGILGLQVGFGIALLKEFIIVGGLQFGTADLTTPWDVRKAWYIGVAIDPWLLQRAIGGGGGED